MSGFQVLVVAGTHGNEVNAPWLLDQWQQNSHLINANGLNVCCVEGNPAALQAGTRYLDRDLNRSFSAELLKAPKEKAYEIARARELLAVYGPDGSNPSQIVIDLHSTTAGMGTSLVVYGRRPPDLAFAALVQARLGLPVYLHEGDSSQQGFLVESWPCGLVVEIGPVAQSLLHWKIIEQTRLVLEGCFDAISKVKSGLANYPKHLVVHRHLGSIDFPRNENGTIEFCLHPYRQGADWEPIQKGDYMFIGLDGSLIKFDGDDGSIPLFINEAAYAEKEIAMSLTKREVWLLSDHWENALSKLIV